MSFAFIPTIAPCKAGGCRAAPQTVAMAGRRPGGAGGSKRPGGNTKRAREGPRESKPNVIELEGVIEESLPNATFRVRLENDVLIHGHISGKIRKNYIKILLGDRVRVEMSPYDLEKGRITFRYAK